MRNEQGASYGIATFGAQSIYNALNFGNIDVHSATGAGVTAAFGVTTMQVIAKGTAAASIQTQYNLVGGGLNTVGAEINYVANQISYNNDKVDALNTGLGSLVDADLAKEFGAVAGAADPPAVGHTGPFAGEPGTADAAEPVQVTA